MKEFFASIHPELQEELLRDGVIELVSVFADAVPDPERPDERLALTIATEVFDGFRPGIPEIERELDRIRATCLPAREDLSPAVLEALLGVLDRHRGRLDELRKGRIGGRPVAWFNDPGTMEIIGPAIRNATPSEAVWCHCWTVAMEDDGKMIVDCEEPSYFSGLDRESRGRVDERLRRVNKVIGGIVERLMGVEAF